MDTKADIRKRMLHIRSTIPQIQQNTWSRTIQEQVLKRPAFQNADWIYLYMDYKSEVQTGFLFEECLKLGKHIALPRVHGSDMEFYEVRNRTDVLSGYKGILEPATTHLVQQPKAFMAVPGVAFSRNRMRLGYGKGFYDRYLQRFPDIYTCALAYECQVLEELPCEEHDVPLKELITEGVIRC